MTEHTEKQIIVRVSPNADGYVREERYEVSWHTDSKLEEQPNYFNAH